MRDEKTKNSRNALYANIVVNGSALDGRRIFCSIFLSCGNCLYLFSKIINMKNIDTVILANQMVDSLRETEFFKENIFVDAHDLSNKLIEKMDVKLETDGEMMLTESEFIEAVKEVHQAKVDETLNGLLDKGAVSMGVNMNGDIIYKQDPNLNV